MKKIVANQKKQKNMEKNFTRLQGFMKLKIGKNFFKTIDRGLKIPTGFLEVADHENNDEKGSRDTWRTVRPRSENISEDKGNIGCQISWTFRPGCFKRR